MQTILQTAIQPRERRLQVRLCSSPAMLEQAQRLRFDVFTREYGAQLETPAAGLDIDRYDEFCDHLVVLDEMVGDVVATTRILPATQADRSGGFYSESEFDLERLKSVLTGRVMEVGRTCVHPDYRNGTTIALLWSGLAEYLLKNRFDYLIGCASIHMCDGGYQAWAITHHLKAAYLVDEAYRVTPRRTLPHLANSTPVEMDVPPLLKAYMRLGARVCGDPCWDPDFRCADLFILLRLQDLSPRYVRHFLKAAATPA